MEDIVKHDHDFSSTPYNSEEKDNKRDPVTISKAVHKNYTHSQKEDSSVNSKTIRENEKDTKKVDCTTGSETVLENDKHSQKCGFFKALKQRVTKMLFPRPKDMNEIDACLTKAEDDVAALKNVLDPLDSEMKALRMNINLYMKQLELYRYTFSWLSKREDLDESACMDKIKELKERLQDLSPLQVIQQCSESELEIYIALLRTEIYVAHEHRQSLVFEMDRLCSHDDNLTDVSSNSSFDTNFSRPASASEPMAVQKDKVETTVPRYFGQRRMTFPLHKDGKKKKRSDIEMLQDSENKNPNITSVKEIPSSFSSMSHCKSISMVNLDRLLKENMESHQCDKFHNFSKDALHFDDYEEDVHDCGFCSNYKHKLLEMEQEQLYQMNILHHTLTQNSIYLHDQKQRNRKLENKILSITSENKAQVKELMDLVNQSGNLLKNIEQEYAMCCSDIYNQIEAFVEDRNKMEHEILQLKEDNEQQLKKFVDNSSELQQRIEDISDDNHKLKPLCIKLYEDLLLAILAYERLQVDLKQQVCKRKKYDTSSCNIWLKKLKNKEISLPILSDRAEEFLDDVSHTPYRDTSLDDVKNILLDVLRTLNSIDNFDKEAKTWLLENIRDVESKLLALSISGESTKITRKHFDSNSKPLSDSDSKVPEKKSGTSYREKNSSDTKKFKDPKHFDIEKKSTDPKKLSNISSRESNVSKVQELSSPPDFDDSSFSDNNEFNAEEIEYIKEEEMKLFEAYDKIISEVRAFSKKGTDSFANFRDKKRLDSSSMASSSLTSLDRIRSSIKDNVVIEDTKSLEKRDLTCFKTETGDKDNSAKEDTKSLEKRDFISFKFETDDKDKLQLDKGEDDSESEDSGTYEFSKSDDVEKSTYKPLEIGKVPEAQEVSRSSIRTNLYDDTHSEESETDDSREDAQKNTGGSESRDKKDLSKKGKNGLNNGNKNDLKGKGKNLLAKEKDKNRLERENDKNRLVKEKDTLDKVNKANLDKADKNNLDKNNKDNLEKVDKDNLDKVNKANLDKADKNNLDKKNKDNLEKSNKTNLDKVDKDTLDKVNKANLDKADKNNVDKRNKEEKSNKTNLDKVDKDTLDKVNKANLDKADENNLDKKNKDNLEKSNKTNLDIVDKDILDKVDKDNLDEVKKNNLDKVKKNNLDKVTKNSFEEKRDSYEAKKRDIKKDSYSSGSSGSFYSNSSYCHRSSAEDVGKRLNEESEKELSEKDTIEISNKIDNLLKDMKEFEKKCCSRVLLDSEKSDPNATKNKVNNFQHDNDSKNKTDTSKDDHDSAEDRKS